MSPGKPPSAQADQAAASVGGAKRSTPMMTQYLQLKDEVGDAILFYRMGDFYEMFFDDALTAAKICDLTLTSRNKSDPNPIPMAGVPWHSAEPHIARLLRVGHRVAICEQVEEPENKGLMRREIVEILTPGTTLADSLLEEGRNNYLIALVPGKHRWGLAVTDVSTGEFSVGEVTEARLSAELEQAGPRELILPREADRNPILATFLREHEGVSVERLDEWQFSPRRGRELLCKQYGVSSLEPFGIDHLEEGLAAAGALLTYAAEQRRSSLGHLRPPRSRAEDDCLLMDEATLSNLELLEGLSGERRHCLLGVLDCTLTPMGRRALRRALARPLTDLARIRARHSAVELLVDDQPGREWLRDRLRGIADLERILARLHSGRAKPVDLCRLRDSLPPVAETIAWMGEENRPVVFPGAVELDPAEDVRALLQTALVEEPPGASQTGLIRSGYDDRLDRVRELATEGEDWIKALQERERKATGIPSLKVSFNKVFGYYIEVTKSQLSRVPDSYQRKQTLVGGERYITPELKEWEERIVGARDQARGREAELIEELKRRVLGETARIQVLAEVVAEWDLVAGFAERSHTNRYVRPHMEESDRLVIEEGRHAVVEHFLSGETFVPNDLHLDSRGRQIQIVTGPNMAGKSTYLRQLGILLVMAQAGCFVPAREATIGVADRLFTRVGASDRIARGQSTFLVEMIETARILHEASSRSVVLLDEIGRGTSTFDGLAIAWAVAEYLRARPTCRPRTLFATHFHELTELARRQDGYQNLNVLVKEWKDEIIFVRRVEPGAADRSYGIQVARLAGLPDIVLKRAKQILSVLEAQGPRNLLSESAGALMQYSLFGQSVGGAVDGAGQVAEDGAQVPRSDVYSQLAEALREIELDALTPRQAMDWLYGWRARLEEEGE